MIKIPRFGDPNKYKLNRGLFTGREGLETQGIGEEEMQQCLFDRFRILYLQSLFIKQVSSNWSVDEQTKNHCYELVFMVAKEFPGEIQISSGLAKERKWFLMSH